MQNNNRVNIFLVILAVGAIIIAIFALSEPHDVPQVPIRDYERNIRELNDTIKTLKEDITKFKLEIERIDIEREELRRKLKQIIEDNERIDTELATGDWDDNIKFLTDFLSEEDNF